MPLKFNDSNLKMKLKINDSNLKMPLKLKKKKSNFKTSLKLRKFNSKNPLKSTYSLILKHKLNNPSSRIDDILMFLFTTLNKYH